MPERSLGFAQAIISGDRLNLSLQVFEDLRRTNLAYLMAISGLHKGLLTTVVFGLLRMVCVVILIGHIRWHAKSIAAFGAILAGGVLFGTVGQFDCNQTYICHDCLILWRCNIVTAHLNASILGACGAYHFGITSTDALFPGVSNVLRLDHCIS